MCSCGGSFLPPSTCQVFLPCSLPCSLLSVACLLFLASFVSLHFCSWTIVFPSCGGSILPDALTQGIVYTADQPTGEVAFSSGFYLSQLAMGRDKELHVKNHKRAMVMTGSPHEIRKEWFQAKRLSAFFPIPLPTKNHPEQIVQKVGYYSDQIPG